ncbi:hypothetical protein GCM10027275_18620 [Rhabdobacter roseus]|uniref:DNA-binding LytR/AlgR family response regulator n=1 Tax=Rhabdobacter roseus TaxID=1655419 RepID=A0A840TLH0_9BACT|nr:response regulator [Rhabdobacter roseus]MBB5283785.1 DNA-binding LytR/AlgR family response regulator [Rhabdobacter roseus]
MNLPKILIVEDEALTATDLKETLQEAGYLITGIARTSQEAVALATSNPPELVLVDIELRGSPLDGISTAQELLQLYRMPVIFLTQYDDRLLFRRAKEILPAAYLPKPYTTDTLLLQVELAWHNFRHTTHLPQDHPLPDRVFLRTKKGFEKVYKQDIVYLEADGVCSDLYLMDKSDRLTLSLGLSYLESYLPDAYFFRLSRSYLINLQHVEKLDTHYVYLKGCEKESLSIPQDNKKELMRRLNVIRGGKDSPR